MMTHLDQQIAQTRQQIERRQRLGKQIDALKLHRAELDRKTISLKVEMQTQQEDVQKLENPGLAAFFYSILGKKEDMLEKERQEARVAAMKYDAAVQELKAVDDWMAELVTERASLYRCENRYAQLLEDKKNILRRSGTPQAQRITELEEKQQYFTKQIKELDEAITAGNRAKGTANGILGKLESALDYSTWDVVGGGLIADIAKHEILDEAQAEVVSLQIALDRFKTELADVQIDADIEVTVEGFLGFADFFFDSLLVDWMVRDRIQQAKGQVQATYWQIESVINKLSTLRAGVQVQLEDVREELRSILET